MSVREQMVGSLQRMSEYAAADPSLESIFAAVLHAFEIGLALGIDEERARQKQPDRYRLLDENGKFTSYGWHFAFLGLDGTDAEYLLADVEIPRTWRLHNPNDDPPPIFRGVRKKPGFYWLIRTNHASSKPICDWYLVRVDEDASIHDLRHGGRTVKRSTFTTHTRTIGPLIPPRIGKHARDPYPGRKKWASKKVRAEQNRKNQRTWVKRHPEKAKQHLDELRQGIRKTNRKRTKKVR